MSWLTDLVRPKINSLGDEERSIPDWSKDPKSGQMVFYKDLERKLWVYPSGYHARMPLAKRLDHVFDGGVYTKVELPEVTPDPLKFRDKERYTDRLRKARNKTGMKDALIVAHGKIGGNNVVVAAFNFNFMGGSMGIAVGEGLLIASRLAKVQEAAFITIPASGGARMQEGILSLMQMPRSVIAVQEVREVGLPYIVLLTDPTYGGVTASFAMLGDVHIAEPGALIGFAGRRVIEQTVREILPDDFQTAEYLESHGMVDIVAPRDEIPETLGRVLSLLMKKDEGLDSLDENQTDENQTDENQVPDRPEISEGASPKAPSKKTDHEK